MEFIPLFKNPLQTIITHSPAKTHSYLGSPTICILPDNSLLVAHDYFGFGSPKNRHFMANTSEIFRSVDQGASWQHIATIKDAFWSSLFVHRNAVYLLGVSAEYGDILIRKSLDQGKTWTDPVDETHGLLFKGGSGKVAPNYHCGAMPVFIDDYVYRAFEDNVTGRWGSGFHATVISAKLDADLLCADSWLMTNKLAYDPTTQPSTFKAFNPGWLEGNVVRAPNGEIWNLLRVSSAPITDKMAKTVLSSDRKTLSFDSSTGFLDFPGGMTKFTIRYDPTSKLYWTLSNEVIDPLNSWQRNFLILASSADLLHWIRHQVLLYEFEPDSLGTRIIRKIIPITKLKSKSFGKKIGFQYVDWQFDGVDLIFVVRTAYNGAHNFHDSNYITFFRLSNFRQFVNLK